MRRLRYLAAVLAVAFGLIGTATAASAAEEFDVDNLTEEQIEEIAHEAELIVKARTDDRLAYECVYWLVRGESHMGEPVNSLDECREAPNPLFPETNEIIWGAFGFFVVLGFVAKFGLPAIRSGMDARTERIRTSIDEADQAKAEAARTLEEYNRQLADARAESSRIIDEARQQAEALKRDLQARAEADAADARQRINDDIAAQVTQAQAGLQAQVAEMSIQLAERVVERNLDRDTNLAIVENLIRDLESQGT